MPNDSGMGESAEWSVQYEGEDGPEWAVLYLDVTPSEFFEEDGELIQTEGWKWEVSASESPFEAGLADSIEEAKRECELAAREMPDPIREP